MVIPTEPIGSIPRPPELIDAIAKTDGADPALDPLYDAAVRDTVARFEATGSPVITDGEQRKYHNFWTYCVHGMTNTAPDGFKIPFASGHSAAVTDCHDARRSCRASFSTLSRFSTWHPIPPAAPPYFFSDFGATFSDRLDGASGSSSGCSFSAKATNSHRSANRRS
jgi:hypothetical protein